MNKYEKSKIYKLVNTENKVYFGSTIQELDKRFSQHKKDLNGVKKNPCKSLELFNCEVKIYLVENYSCNNKKELHERERFYIENNDCINKYIPNRTSKEHYQDNKERIIKRNKEWREKNKNKYSDYMKERYQQQKDKLKEYQKIKIICECGTSITKGKYARHKKTQKHLNLL